MQEDWKQRVVFLTGASSGIGRALAVELGRAGAHLALAARREARLEAAAEEVRDGGGEARVFPLDVTDARALQKAVEETGRTLGPPETVIANAGIGADTDVRDLDLEQTRHVFDVNVHGALATLKPAIGPMLERGSGHLVVISSLAAYHGLPEAAAYCASKAAITRFCDTLRVELASDGIDVTTVHPGFVDTEISEDQDEMPMVMSSEEAARRIRRGLEKRKRRFAFPLPLSLLSRAVRAMPLSIHDGIAARLVPEAPPSAAE